MATLDDYQKQIVTTFAGVLLAVLGWLIINVLNATTKQDVEKMLIQSEKSSEYMRDRDNIQRSLQDLYTTQGKIFADMERIRDMALTNNEKIWRELSLIRVEIERIRINNEMLAEDKKK